MRAYLDLADDTSVQVVNTKLSHFARQMVCFKAALKLTIHNVVVNKL